MVNRDTGKLYSLSGHWMPQAQNRPAAGPVNLTEPVLGRSLSEATVASEVIMAAAGAHQCLS